MQLTFDAEVWEHEGPTSWHFVTLPVELADDVSALVEGRTGGFGSVRVEVTVGATTWATSLFPDSARGTYLLPVKQAVRTAEGLADGAQARVTLRVLV